MDRSRLPKPDFRKNRWDEGKLENAGTSGKINNALRKNKAEDPAVFMLTRDSRKIPYEATQLLLYVCNARKWEEE
jgi:hypothetical protein